MVKIVTLFLIFIAVLAIFGQLRLLVPKKIRAKAKPCPKCGRYRIGSGPCGCDRKG